MHHWMPHPKRLKILRYNKLKKKMAEADGGKGG
jgi:hypothetical protein